MECVCFQHLKCDKQRMSLWQYVTWGFSICTTLCVFARLRRGGFNGVACGMCLSLLSNYAHTRLFEVFFLINYKINSFIKNSHQSLIQPIDKLKIPLKTHLTLGQFFGPHIAVIQKFEYSLFFSGRDVTTSHLLPSFKMPHITCFMSVKKSKTQFCCQPKKVFVL